MFKCTEAACEARSETCVYAELKHVIGVTKPLELNHRTDAASDARSETCVSVEVAELKQV